MGAYAEETAVIVCAVIAMISSLGMIVTYYACANWRRELRRIKTLLLILSIFQFFASLAELDIDRNKSDLRCRIQGSMIQMFGIGSAIYEGLLAVETAISVSEVHGNHSTTVLPTYQNFYKARLVVYNILVFTFGLVCVVISNVNDYYGEENVAGYLCYIPGSSTKVKIMGVLPVVLSVSVMLVLNLYSWWVIVSILKNLVPNSNQDEDLLLQNSVSGSALKSTSKGIFCCQEIRGYVSAAKRLEPATRRNVFRMLCIPLMYVVVLIIPSVIIRLTEKAVWAYTVAVCSVISTATVNFICWVVLDEEALHDLMSVTWGGMMTQRESGSSVNSNRPRSVDDDSEDDAVRNQLACSKVQQKRDSYSAMSAQFLYNEDDESGNSLLA